jgi:ribosome-associated protein
LKGREFANYIAKIIRDKKGRDVKVFNAKNFTVFTDYFVISTVEVAEHGKAIMEEISKNIQDRSILFVERDKNFEWIVIDCGDVIVHLMTEEKRNFYRIEALWSHASNAAITIRKANILTKEDKNI